MRRRYGRGAYGTQGRHDYCETEVLAQTRYCVIGRCRGCRTYHLHLGAVSLRLREAVFSDLCAALSGVLQRLGREVPPVGATRRSH